MKYLLPAVLLVVAACAETAVDNPSAQKAFQPATVPAAPNGATVQRIGNKTIIIGSIH